MRKSLFVVALLALVPAAAHAQFGMKGGVTFNTIDTENGGVDFDSKTGFVGGVSYGFRLSWRAPVRESRRTCSAAVSR